MKPKKLTREGYDLWIEGRGKYRTITSDFNVNRQFTSDGLDVLVEALKPVSSKSTRYSARRVELIYSPGGIIISNILKELVDEAVMVLDKYHSDLSLCELKHPEWLH